MPEAIAPEKAMPITVSWERLVRSDKKAIIKEMTTAMATEETDRSMPKRAPIAIPANAE